MTSDCEWKALVEIIGQPELANNPRYATASARIARRDEVNGLVTSWCKASDADAAAALLQSAGVAAHVSWSASDIVTDPHMSSRNSIVEVTESDGKTRKAIGFPARFSKSEAPGMDRGTPALGEHEDYVFGELLGIGARERARLVDTQVIF